MLLLGNFYLNTAIILLAAYLIGSIPAAYIAGRIKGIDIRKTGSRNVGGMNTFTSVGKIAGVIVALFDMGKGALVAWLAGIFSNHHLFVLLAAVVAAIIGHNWMIFIGFKGGKGLSTLVGALFFLSPLSILFLYLLFMAAAIILFRDTYVSQGMALFFFSFFMWYREGSYYWCIFLLLVTAVYSIKCYGLYRSYITEGRRDLNTVVIKIFKPFLPKK
ncbi:MAG: glycerol-3-phosphate acyltransferase [Actinobacteria bacterium]|nr:glycerol-3-phosphate acyltransferase [Actinomycetota bacterium]